MNRKGCEHFTRTCRWPSEHVASIILPISSCSQVRRSTPPKVTELPLAAVQNALLELKDKQRLARSDDWMSFESGYELEQSTKPQTVGYSLADSPVGLLAWIYEKLVTWTDDYPWTDDEGVATMYLRRLRTLLPFLAEHRPFLSDHRAPISTHLQPQSSPGSPSTGSPAPAPRPPSASTTRTCTFRLRKTKQALSRWGSRSSRRS